jgi:PIN domain nuclease of toxin-antitoxin system
VRLLLDTHALLWALGEPSRLERSARAAVEDGGNDVWVSAASIWEISIKRALGKLTLTAELEDAIAAAAFTPLPIALAHADRAGALPLHHRDPFDRMLVAQAMLESMTIVTRDPRFEPYGLPLLKA